MTRRLALVSDAWLPQVNGVVTTLIELIDRLRERHGFEIELIEPSAFRTFACPGYREIALAWRPARRVSERLDAFAPDAIHIATEGPLGSAARRWCLEHGMRFTTAFHTRFPDILARALHLPERIGYAWFRRFHAPSAAVMVPTPGMLAILRGHGFANLVPWSHGVDLSMFAPVPGADLGLPRPVWLYVGRVSYEKNLESFLSLDLPGSKVVYGVGPLLDRLRNRYPNVHWRGVVPRDRLPAIYSAADAFVFPSTSETFGLVMLEAMACGTPVAAYPVPGPLDVVGGSDAGALHGDLRLAALAALSIPRDRPRARAMEFDWDEAATQFAGHLVSARSPRAVTEAPQKIHKLAR